jgi:transposase
MHTLAIDLAKDELVAFLLDHQGQPIHSTPCTFPQTPAGYRALIAWMSDPLHTRVVFESTGVYGKRMMRALQGRVASLHEMNPRTLKRAALHMTQTKTDHADARAIAEAGHLLAASTPHILEHNRVAFDPLTEEIEAWLSEYDRLRKTITRLQCQIQNIACHPTPAARTITKRRENELHRLRQDQNQVKKQIEKLVGQWTNPDAELLQTITGIGVLTTAAVVTAIRRIERFASADALKGYFGLYPSRRQSGAVERSSRMAKHGSALVRHMLWNAAKSAARFNDVCRALFERLQEKGRAAPACYGAVCRKLVQLIYGVLKNQTPFQKHQPST